MHNSIFYTLDRYGMKVLRDLKKENVEKKFSVQRYYNKEDGLDDLNYMYYENYEMFGIYDCIGSDYERYGCILEEGDVVVDIGANIGMFTRRALEKGASRVISFEPISHTFSCLVDNEGLLAECHKIAIGKNLSVCSFAIPDNISNLGGGSREDLLENREKVKIEKCVCMGLEDLWNLGILPEKIDFLKIDCEGGEKEIIESITDERLINIRKISMEYHQLILGENLRQDFTRRCFELGFQSFTLFHGDSGLVQVHLWR